MKLLEDIDELLAYLEDSAHGEEGKRITEMRYRILTELSNSHKPVVMQAKGSGRPSLNDVKNSIAKEQGFDSWDTCLDNHIIEFAVPELMDLLAIRYQAASVSGAAVGDGAAGQNVRDGKYDTYKKGDELYGG